MKEYGLRCNQQIRLDGGVTGSIVCCRQGVLWVTQTGNPGDHLVRAGEVFSSDRPGRIVIGALEDSVFFVAENNAGAGLPSGAILRGFRKMLRRVEWAGRGL